MMDLAVDLYPSNGTVLVCARLAGHPDLWMLLDERGRWRPCLSHSRPLAPPAELAAMLDSAVLEGLGP